MNVSLKLKHVELVWLPQVAPPQVYLCLIPVSPLTLSLIVLLHILSEELESVVCLKVKLSLRISSQQNFLCVLSAPLYVNNRK